MNKFITKLTESFYYCQENEYPCIQIGGKSDNSFIFWLKYDESEIMKCSAEFVREFGEEFGINDIGNAKKIILGFASEGFNAIDANFFDLNVDSECVRKILSNTHIETLASMFVQYIYSKTKKEAYIFLMPYTYMDGSIEINQDVKIYGSGQIDNILNDIKSTTGIFINKSNLNQEYFRDDPVNLYLKSENSSIILVYASSKEEISSTLNNVFGALCITIDNPFRINQLSVDSRLNRFTKCTIDTIEVNINFPSVYEVKITKEVALKIKEILNTENKKLKIALAYTAYGWKHNKKERFINHYTAIDAIYGNKYKNRKSIIDGVNSDAQSIESIDSKINAIYDLRCILSHGETSSLEQNSEYVDFVLEHGSDPVDSLFYILSHCLNKQIK
ncbi:TPA: hypothetical protein RQK01_002324 [Vibrio vulnificus]|nr:hypothetical protein [Vibrio vulnificus]